MNLIRQDCKKVKEGCIMLNADCFCANNCTGVSEKEWIKNQGGCCIPDCDEKPEHIDNLDNVFCDDCAEQNFQEEPENWE